MILDTELCRCADIPGDSLYEDATTQTVFGWCQPYLVIPMGGVQAISSFGLSLLSDSYYGSPIALLGPASYFA